MYLVSMCTTNYVHTYVCNFIGIFSSFKILLIRDIIYQHNLVSSFKWILFHELKHNQHIWELTLHFMHLLIHTSPLSKKREGTPSPFYLPPKPSGLPHHLLDRALHSSIQMIIWKEIKKTFRSTTWMLNVDISSKTIPKVRSYTRVITVAEETLNRPPIAEKILRKIGRRKMTQLVLVGIKTELHTSEFGRFSLCKIVRKNVIYTKNCRFDNSTNS